MKSQAIPLCMYVYMYTENVVLVGKIVLYIYTYRSNMYIYMRRCMCMCILYTYTYIYAIPQCAYIFLSLQGENTAFLRGTDFLGEQEKRQTLSNFRDLTFPISSFPTFLDLTFQLLNFLAFQLPTFQHSDVPTAQLSNFPTFQHSKVRPKKLES